MENETTAPEVLTVEEVLLGTQEEVSETVEELPVSADSSSHPLLTTPFSEYTVTEGLLLFIFLALLLDMTVGRWLREVF